MYRAWTWLLLIHGIIHCLGFFKAFGIAELPQLTQPISRPLGVLWLLAALSLIASAFAPPRLFWIIGAVALALSQVCIATAWADAKFGTGVNAILLLAVVYRFASAGPLSFAAEFQRDVAAALTARHDTGIVSEADLAPLPPPVQRYLRVVGAVGQPRIYNYRARWQGRIRSDSAAPWMPMVADQLSTVGPDAQRFFKLTARMKGVPADVYHRFTRSGASFRVRIASLIPSVNAAGPDMTRAETVTVLNDMCLLAPAALIDPALRWEPIDERAVRVMYTHGAETVRAELHFDELGQLVDFISDDRLRAAPDGRSFTRQRWSTPLENYRSFGARRVGTHGTARWHAPEGTFVYADFELLDIAYNIDR